MAIVNFTNYISSATNNLYYTNSGTSVSSTATDSLSTNHQHFLIDQQIQYANMAASIRRRVLSNADDYIEVCLANGLEILVKGDGSVTHSVSGRVQLSKINVEDGTILQFPDGTVIHTHDDEVSIEKFVNASQKLIDVTGTITLYECLAFCHFHNLAIPEGSGGGKLTLPNGCVIEIFSDDTIKIIDKDAKVLYEPPKTRGFNKYLNSSDLLEEFIKYCGKQNISKTEFMDLPVSLFIYWLIVRVAEEDEEDPGEAQLLLTTTVKQKVMHNHKCKDCGKFLTKKLKEHSVFFCDSVHMDKYMRKINA